MLHQPINPLACSNEEIAALFLFLGLFVLVPALVSFLDGLALGWQGVQALCIGSAISSK
jgi:hypothetical protein